MSAYLNSEYESYVEQCENDGEYDILSYEEWKESEGYRGEYGD